MRHAHVHILFGNKNAILAPGKHCDVVWQLPIKLWGSAVPLVPDVPQVPRKMYHKYLKYHLCRRRQNLFGNSYYMPNNIGRMCTGAIFVLHMLNPLTKF